MLIILCSISKTCNLFFKFQVSGSKFIKTDIIFESDSSISNFKKKTLLTVNF